MPTIGVPERILTAGAVLLLAGGVFAAVTRPDAGSGDDAAAPAGSTDVSIQNFNFGPAELDVAVGATVTWTNEDKYAHTVAGMGGAQPEKSPDLNTGDTYQFTFTEPGTYDYVCTIHAQMHGTIVVGDQ